MHVDSLSGRIIDLDSHEMIPIKLWGDYFGDIGQMLSILFSSDAAASLADCQGLRCEIDGDLLEITADSVWHRVGWETEPPRAPGAIDMKRRLAVLDEMSVRQQLIFPGFGFLGMILVMSPPEFIQDTLAFDVGPEEMVAIRKLGHDIINSSNNWLVEQVKIDPDRLRFVAPLICDQGLGELMSEAERLIDLGVRAFFLPASQPPAGMSPADRELTPFWSLCESANVAVCFHVLADNFARDTAWGRVPEFHTARGKSVEFVLDPYFFSSLHFAIENYLAVLILGGVLERHPGVNIGVFECGANWFGPLALHLDMWASRFPKRTAASLSMPPSGYLARNVRVCPFSFEPVDTYIERYGFEDVYCYSSDYPHTEGGVNQLNVFAEKLMPLGDSVMEKFFVTNAELLMPPL